MSWIEDTSKRGSKWKHLVDGNKHRLEITLHDQHFKDGVNWLAVDEAIYDDASVTGYTSAAKGTRHLAFFGANAVRRWVPRRDYPNEYVTFGRPQYYRVSNGTWANLNVGTITKSGNVLTCTSTNQDIKLTTTWRGMKVEVILKNTSAYTRYRIPMSLTGLTYDGGNIMSGSTQVGLITQTVSWDSTTPLPKTLPSTYAYSGGYIEFSVDTTGAVFPVTIDPSPYSSQPDGTDGVDALIRPASATTNFGVFNRLFIGTSGDLGGITRSLVKFDLTALPADATLDTVTFSLWCYYDASSNARTFYVYRTKRAWVEGTRDAADDNPATGVTWNRYDTTNNWSTAGGFHADDCEQTDIGSRAMTATEATGEFKDWVLSPTTKANLDLGNGWLIKSATENESEPDGYGFRSSDWETAGERPKLVIAYTEAGGGEDSAGGTITAIRTNSQPPFWGRF